MNRHEFIRKSGEELYAEEKRVKEERFAFKKHAISRMHALDKSSRVIEEVWQERDRQDIYNQENAERVQYAQDNDIPNFTDVPTTSRIAEIQNEALVNAYRKVDEEEEAKIIDAPPLDPAEDVEGFYVSKDTGSGVTIVKVETVIHYRHDEARVFFSYYDSHSRAICDNRSTELYSFRNDYKKADSLEALPADMKKDDRWNEFDIADVWAKVWEELENRWWTEEGGTLEENKDEVANENAFKEEMKEIKKISDDIFKRTRPDS